MDGGKSKIPCFLQVFQGNRPTNSIVFKKLTPYTLGALTGETARCLFRGGVDENTPQTVLWQEMIFDDT